MEATEKKKAVPPYVAYRTLVNFLDRFKQGIPGRIDRGLMASMSGAAQSQVTTALRYLGMITENNLPTLVLREYAAGEEVERKNALRGMLQLAYPFIFGEEFDLSTATASQLREAFAKHTSATGETLQRCINFFKDAAADADIVVSPYITQKQARNQGSRKKAVPRREEKSLERSTPSQSRTPAAQPMPTAQPPLPALTSLLLRGLFERMPKPGMPWPREDRDHWMRTFENILILEYPES